MNRNFPKKVLPFGTLTNIIKNFNLMLKIGLKVNRNIFLIIKCEYQRVIKSEIIMIIININMILYMNEPYMLHNISRNFSIIQFYSPVVLGKTLTTSQD